MVCVYVCAPMHVHVMSMGMLRCTYSLPYAELKGDTFRHFNVGWFVSSKRVNNVMLIRKDKTQTKLMEFIKGTINRH